MRHGYGEALAGYGKLHPQAAFATESDLSGPRPSPGSTCRRLQARFLHAVSVPYNPPPRTPFTPMHMPSTDEAEGSLEVLHTLLGACARQLVADGDARTFSDWFVTAVPRLAPALIAQAIEPDQFARVLARAIHSITPLPTNAYAPRRLPAPGRNEACFCGSGRKYKHCCERLDAHHPFADVNMLRYVLDAVPVARFAELPGSRAGLDAVAHAAMEWEQEGAAARAIALLEPWFAGDGPLDERHAYAFDLLMNLYLGAGKEKKRQALIESALRRGDRAMQSTAWQRR